MSHTDFTSSQTTKLLLRKGFSSLGSFPTKGEALIWATAKGDENLVQILVDEGANVDARREKGVCPLHLAAANGYCKTLTILHAANADILAIDDDGWTPLHYAAHFGLREAIHILVAQGADLHYRDGINGTPLHAAARKNDCETIQTLLDLKSNLNAQTTMGFSPLFVAVQNGHLEVIDLLLELGSDTTLRAMGGMNITHMAAMHGYIPILEYLLSKKYHAFEQDDRGRTPLCWAAQANESGAVEFLLQHGANVEQRVTRVDLALQMAAWAGNADMLRVFAQHNVPLDGVDEDGHNLLHFACLGDSEDTMQYLIESGVDIDGRDVENMTPLLRAASVGKPLACQFLANQGANLGAQGKDGWSALHFAVQQNDKRLIRFLIEQGASTESRADSGQTPLSLAAMLGHREIVSMLISANANIATKCDQWLSPLHYAAKHGNQDVVMTLIDNGAETGAETKDGNTARSLTFREKHINITEVLKDETPVSKRSLEYTTAQSRALFVTAAANGNLAETYKTQTEKHRSDADGQTPVSVAAQKGHEDIVASLLENQSDPNSATSYGMTPLIFATKGAYLRVVELLIQFGADIQYACPDGNTALSLAEASSHKEILELLRKHADIQNAPDRLLERTGEPKKNSQELSKYSARLHIAAKYGRIAEIKRLLKVGMKAYGYREAPLFAAASEGQDTAVTLLVDNDADIEARDESEATPMHRAASSGHTSTIRLLHKKGSKLNYVDEDGHKDAVQLLLELGAKMEIKDTKLGSTALWAAAMAQHINVVEVLLEKGANIEAANSDGYTPLSTAVLMGNRPMVEFLLQRKVKMRPCSIRNYSPLCTAANTGFEGIVDLLVEYGADLNHLSDGRNTPIIWAARQRHSMVVRMLIEMGADIDIRNDDGRTALSYAKEMGHESVVRLLSQAATLRLADGRAMTKQKQKSLDARRLYEYQSLLNDRYIRVLELAPGKKGDIISFELYEVDLECNPSYEALSYEWIEKIGTAALENIRSETSPKTLWVDAICINQRDTQERNAQVALMTEIFRKAKTVLLWIGDETKDTGYAFSYLPRFATVYRRMRKDPNDIRIEMRELDELEGGQNLKEIVMGKESLVKGLKDLSFRTYFTRAWIYQEIILAGSRGLVVCGNYTCPWETFREGLLGFRAFGEFWNYQFQGILRGEEIMRRFGFVALAYSIGILQSFMASDPRDKVFASLGLSEMDGRLVADYTLTVQEVYINAARYFIDLNQGETIWDAAYQISPKTVPGLPSWAIDFTSRKETLTSNPFQAPKEDFFLPYTQTRPGTTHISLHRELLPRNSVDGCIFDRVATKISVTREREIYDIFKHIAKGLARQGRSIYDPYLASSNRLRKDCSNMKRPKWATALRAHIRRKSCELRSEKKRRRKSHLDSFKQTNFQAFLKTLFYMPSIHEILKKDLPLEYDPEIAEYLAWKLSADSDTPRCSKRPLKCLRRLTRVWSARSRRREDYELDICYKMEDDLFLDPLAHVDFVLSENGYLGLTNSKQAKKGMPVAFITGSDHPIFLRRLRKARRNGTMLLGGFSSITWARVLRRWKMFGALRRWRGWRSVELVGAVRSWLR
ncbi:ankyrin repeat-containing domain protein [Xylariaceae sp. FL1651]|nr:ankyrin repeat-containing domain protein [Xylariaceae sp. FL1651]